LSEAVLPLRDAFGEGRRLKVRAQQSEDDGLLKVAVQLPADFGGDAEHALSFFDKEWWIKTLSPFAWIARIRLRNSRCRLIGGSF